MNTWHDARERITQRGRASAAAQSKRKALLKIFSVAEEHRIDPSFAVKAPISNLEDIITEAKRAIRWENWGDLHQLFWLASRLTNIELRLAIHSQEVERVSVNRIGDEFVMRLTTEQFARIQSQTRARHAYLVTDGMMQTRAAAN